MKTLIVFATKYGSTKTCVNYMAKRLNGEVHICNLTEGDNPKLDNYETIIIGSSVYAGKIRKEMQLFCRQNNELLQKKKIALFICSGFPSAAEPLFSSNFAELSNQALIKGIFGGELNIDKMGALDKLVANIVTKKSKQDTPKILYQNIDEFAENINKIVSTL